MSTKSNVVSQVINISCLTYRMLICSETGYFSPVIRLIQSKEGWSREEEVASLRPEEEVCAKGVERTKWKCKKYWVANFTKHRVCEHGWSRTGEGESRSPLIAANLHSICSECGFEQEFTTLWSFQIVVCMTALAWRSRMCRARMAQT